MLKHNDNSSREVEDHFTDEIKDLYKELKTCSKTLKFFRSSPIRDNPAFLKNGFTIGEYNKRRRNNRISLLEDRIPTLKIKIRKMEKLKLKIKEEFIQPFLDL